MCGRFQIECQVTVEFDGDRRARSVLQALQVDDEGFVTTRCQGGRLIMDAKSDSVGKLCHTLDDYLSCLQVAEGSVKVSMKGKDEING